MSNSLKTAISVGILVIVAIVIYIFSNTVIWIVDDINYQFNMATGGLLNSVWDIFISQWEHYFTVNGRYVAHWLVQLYCGILGQTVFAVCNAMVYVVFIVMLLKLVGSNIRNVLGLLTASLLLLLLYDTLYGPACQIGFVWTFALVTGWLYLFFNNKQTSVLYCAGIFLFSIIAGEGQEAICIGVSGALIIYAVKNYRKMSREQWVMFFGFGIGSLVLCLSPASYGRAESLKTPLYVTLFNTMTYLRVFYVLLIVVVVAKVRRQITMRGFYRENSFYINAMVILLVFNMLIGVYGNRQLMGVELMAAILVLKLLPENRFNIWTLAALFMVVIGQYSVKWIVIKQYKKTYDDIVTLYQESRDGIVYYDVIFSKYRYVCGPSSTFTKLNAGVATLDKLLQSKGSEKKLRVYPACLQSLEGRTEVENQVVEFDDGCFVVIQSKANPAEFVLKRELNFGIYRRPFKDFVFTWDEPLVETDVYRANLIYDEVPLVDNIKVEIQE